MQLCPKCNFTNPSDSDSCPKCGVVYAKVARIRREAIQERRLSDLVEKELSAGEAGGDDSFDLALREHRVQEGGYPVAQIISGFLYFMAGTTLLFTIISAVWVWHLLGEANQIWVGLGIKGGIFTAQGRVFIITLEIFGGLTLSALLAAAAAGLGVGRDIALNTQMAKEYLHRLYVRGGSRRD